jgi:hypothetical protein
MIPTIGQIEKITRVTPLGLRFWDTVSGNSVGQDLTVTAYPLTDPSRRTRAIPNRSGIYLLQNLPGLREIEYGYGDAAFWSNLAEKSFVIEVVDHVGRFQPFTFQIDLPFRDIFTSPCPLASPPVEPSNPLGVPLYTALTRSVPSGMAVIYATLWDASQDQPASWAVVEASLEGQLLARSFADLQGRIALLFPYPEPVHSIASPLSSPLIGNRPPLVDQIWPIQLSAFYAPWHPIPEIPDLCQIFNQSPAILLSELSPASPLADIMLPYGQALVVRSESQSIVWVVP